MTTKDSLKLSAIQIRSIEQKDNGQLAVIVRDTLTEFGANVPGTVYFDPTTDAIISEAKSGLFCGRS